MAIIKVALPLATAFLIWGTSVNAQWIRINPPARLSNNQDPSEPPVFYRNPHQYRQPKAEPPSYPDIPQQDAEFLQGNHQGLPQHNSRLPQQNQRNSQHNPGFPQQNQRISQHNPGFPQLNQRVPYQNPGFPQAQVFPQQNPRFSQRDPSLPQESPQIPFRDAEKQPIFAARTPGSENPQGLGRNDNFGRFYIAGNQYPRQPHVFTDSPE